jgi:hypothetical protein
VARLVEKISGVKQTFGVDDEAARFKCDAGQEPEACSPPLWANAENPT